MRMTCVRNCRPPLDPLKGWHRENVDIVEAGDVDAESSSTVKVDIASPKSMWNNPCRGDNVL